MLFFLCKRKKGKSKLKMCGNANENYVSMVFWVCSRLQITLYGIYTVVCNPFKKYDLDKMSVKCFCVLSV